MSNNGTSKNKVKAGESSAEFGDDHSGGAYAGMGMSSAFAVSNSNLVAVAAIFGMAYVAGSYLAGGQTPSKEEKGKK